MPRMELLKDGDSVVTEDVDVATADAMISSFNEHAAGSYKPQEFPKWVDTPKGPSYVANQEEEDALHGVKDNDDFVPVHPQVQSGVADIVTPTYPGDGYGYVDGQRVSDDRLPMADVSVPGMDTGLEPAKGPVRTNMEAALQDVTFTTGDHAQALRDKAQANKDAIADAAAHGGASGVASSVNTVTTAPDLAGQPVPQNTPAETTDTAVAPATPNAPDALGADNGEAVPTSNPVTTAPPHSEADEPQTPANP